MSSSNDPTATWRLRVYPLAVLATLGIVLLVATVRYDVGDPDTRLGGDYPSFYAAGSIVASGASDELYSPERQQAEQAGLIDDEGGYLYFSYPPFVAGAYALLALLGYQWSFLLHTLLMTGALAGAIWALRPWLKGTGLPFAALLVVALAFQPVLTAVVGGQNTMLSLLLFALAARFDHEDRPFAAGLAAAVLLFKPQFGIVVLPLLVVGRRWRMLGGWAVGALALFAASTLVMGGNWLSYWWEQAGAFRDLNASANGANFISVPGFLENLLGTGSRGAFLLGYGLAAAIGAVVAWEWWRRARPSNALWRWALAGGAAMLAAPQTLFYDAGLLLLVLVAILPKLSHPGAVVAAVVLVSWLQALGSGLGWSPLGPLGFTAFLAVVIWRTRSAGVAAGAS